MKKIFCIIFILCISFLLVSCSVPRQQHDSNDSYYNYDRDTNDDEFQDIKENSFIKTDVKDKSNISLSNNTAAYSFIRSQINEGNSIDSNVVRIEEMVNFFKYDYNQPKENDVFGFKSEIIQTPWNPNTYLMMIGLETEKMDLEDIANNIVLLVDVSGSMASPNKLTLAKEAFKLLVEQMGKNDVISLVTYASGEKIVFQGKSINDYDSIIKDINKLEANGATAGQKGLQTAYEVAREYFIENGNNRIVLATDGDYNVGISDTDELVEYISEKRKTGIYFSAYGFGMGNYKDEKLERIAGAGNGVYHYIDDISSARKAFVDDINGTLYTVARDAKAQITFNKNSVLEYRLIGYENRKLSDEQFDDDTTDAGEIGTGLQVTAIYELKLNNNRTEDIGSLLIRYKDNDTKNDEVYEDSFKVTNNISSTPSSDAKFIGCVVEFGLILLNSKYKQNANLENVIERLEADSLYFENYYRKDFIDLVIKYKKIVKSK